MKQSKNIMVGASSRMRLPRYYASLDSIRNNFVIPLIVNLIAAAIAYFFTYNVILTVLILFAGISLIIGVYWLIELLIRKRLAAISIEDIIPYTDKARPTDIIPLNTRLQGVTKRFLFMGVSAKSLWDTNLVDILNNPKYRKCSFRFLLLDPSTNSLHQHAENEGTTNFRTIQYDIQAFVRHLADI